MTNLLFDLDGTLVDSREGILSSLKLAFASLDRETPSDSQLEGVIGPPIHQSISHLLNTRDEKLIWQAVRAYRQHYAEVGINGHAVYDGLANTLEYLKTAGARMFVATSKPVTFAAQIIQQHGLSDFFKTVYGSELDGTRSDKGELIAYVLASEGLSPDTCLMIGDRKHDIIGAVKNSVDSAGVLWGYGSRDELVVAGANRILERPSCLTDLVD